MGGIALSSWAISCPWLPRAITWHTAPGYWKRVSPDTCMDQLESEGSAKRGRQEVVRMPCKGANQLLNEGTMRLRCMSTLRIVAEPRCAMAGGPYLSPG